MVALIASLENGTYQESHKSDNEVISIEEYTKMRLGGPDAMPKTSREQLRAAGIFFEEIPENINPPAKKE